MSGKEQIKEGLARNDIGVKPGFEARLTNSERRISEALVAGGEGRDYALEALDRIEEIEEADEHRAAMQDSAANTARNFATFFALASVGTLLTLKAVGLVEVTLLGAFVPALAVIASLAFVSFMASRGYHWLNATFDTIFVLIVAALILAIMPVAIVIALLGFLLKPLRKPITAALDWLTKRVKRTSQRTADKLATT